MICKEEMYTLLKEIWMENEDLRKQGTDCLKFSTWEMLMQVMADIKEDIRQEASKKNGVLNQRKVAEAVIKEAIKREMPTAYHGLIKQPDGKSYVCEGHVAIAFEKDLDLDYAFEDEVRIYKIMESVRNKSDCEVNIPTEKEILSGIKEIKAKAKLDGVKPSKTSVVYYFGNGLCMNAKFLLWAVQATGETTAKFENKRNDKGIIITPLYFKGTDAEAIALPINIPPENISKKGFDYLN